MSKKRPKEEKSMQMPQEVTTPPTVSTVRTSGELLGELTGELTGRKLLLINIAFSST